jgi:hypothetical protein
MQHLLAANGCYVNEANTSNYDGVWGNGTDNAKKTFDNDHGLAVLIRIVVQSHGRAS